MITTNTGAKKLESSDNWREIFPNPGTGTAGAHNATVDAQDRIQAEVAPIINGKRCSLGAASGDYVLLRNSTIAGKTDGAYQAAKAIPANTDLDSTYLGSAITGGIVNELNGNITKKIDKPIGYDYANKYRLTKNVSFTAPCDGVLEVMYSFADKGYLYLVISGTTTFYTAKEWDGGVSYVYPIYKGFTALYTESTAGAVDFIPFNYA